LLAPLPGQDPAPVREAYVLRRAEDGSGDLLYESAGFDARIHRDGSVRFHDKRLSLTFFPWLPYRTNARGPTLESLLRGALLGKPSRSSSSASSGRGNDPWRPSDEPALTTPTMSRYRADPSEGCRYPNPCFFDAPVLLLSVAITFDLTDELMRLGGQDPYRYEKARFMTGTRELRIRLAARAHGDDVREASALLRQRLGEIAGDEELSLGDRRAIIEALARELDAHTPEGEAARASIDEFLRNRLPSPDGGVPAARRP
jgi:hypothetical protein